MRNVARETVRVVEANRGTPWCLRGGYAVATGAIAEALAGRRDDAEPFLAVAEPMPAAGPARAYTVLLPSVMLGREISVPPDPAVMRGQHRQLIDAARLHEAVALAIQERCTSCDRTSSGSTISRTWIYELVKRFRQGGYPALEPGSRRPLSCPHQHGPTVEQRILALGKSLAAAGHDAGAATIAYHLRGKLTPGPAVSTIWRILCRHGLVTPEPHKRPRSSFIRFQAALPNELWQTDATHWSLSRGRGVEILNMIDDHSRLLVASVAFRTVKAADVVEVFHQGALRSGYPAALLSDNAAVFSGRSRQGKVVLQTELERLGIECKHSTPYHPQTCGKVERFHQTLKKYLAKQPKTQSIALLQLQLDTYRTYYNQHRPHRALGGRTPLVAFKARLRAKPAATAAAVHFRVRHDRVDTNGTVTLRYQSRLRHIAIGRVHKYERVRLLIADDLVRVIREDGSLIRELTLDPGCDYQSLELSSMS